MFINNIRNETDSVISHISAYRGSINALMNVLVCGWINFVHSPAVRQTVSKHCMCLVPNLYVNDLEVDTFKLVGASPSMEA